VRGRRDAPAAPEAPSPSRRCAPGPSLSRGGRGYGWAIAAALALFLGSGEVAADAALPALCIDEAAISVSGISSGGFMAHQFHVAHSSRIMGAAIIAGGPYACAGDNFPANLFRTLSICSAIGAGPFAGPPNADRSIEAIRAAAAAGAIDAPAGLRGDRVFLFSGRQDTLVPTSVVDTVATVYRAFDDATAITFVDTVDAPHAMLTPGFGNACATMAPPFINACGFDLAGAALQQIYGPLAPPKSAEGELRRFPQAEFALSPAASSLGATGFVYIPKACAAGAGCRLHVAFHGCGQSETTIGDTFARHAGYDGWAEANDIVVLYPQAAPLVRRVAGFGVAWPNPQGCWDWWGFTGPNFARRDGPQIAAVTAMIDRLAGRDPVSGSSAPACASSAGG